MVTLDSQYSDCRTSMWKIGSEWPPMNTYYAALESPDREDSENIWLCRVRTKNGWAVTHGQLHTPISQLYWYPVLVQYIREYSCISVQVYQYWNSLSKCTCAVGNHLWTTARSVNAFQTPPCWPHHPASAIGVKFRGRLTESAKAGLALGGYESWDSDSGYEISYRYPLLSVGFRYRYFLAMRFPTDSTGFR